MTIQLYESVLSFFGPLLGGDLVDVLFGSILVLAISAPIVGFARKRLAAAACSLLFIPIVFLLLLIPVMEAELNAGISIAVAYVAMGLLLGALPVVLILLPAGRVVQRFMFILVGFGILLGLNELSKLNLGQYF
jgi:hypothetical protein